MSLSSIVNAFPEAVGYLHTASQILSGATQADSSPSLGFEEVGATDVGAVFVVPIFDIAPAAVPPTDTLLGCDQLFLRMVSKNAVLPTGFDVVCAIVGGAVLAAAHIAEGQTGITLKGVTHLVVPRAWVLERAKADGLYTAAAGALTSGAPRARPAVQVARAPPIPQQAPAAVAAPRSQLDLGVRGGGEGSAAPQSPLVLDGEGVRAAQLLLGGRDSDCRFTTEQLEEFGSFLETGAVQKGTQVTY